MSPAWYSDFLAALGSRRSAGEARRMLHERTADALRDDGWQPIETAPQDGTHVLIYAGERAGLPAFQCVAAYHPDGGWCVDELRYAVAWQPLPEPPAARTASPTP
jgi:hypothetical protein